MLTGDEYGQCLWHLATAERHLECLVLSMQEATKTHYRAFIAAAEGLETTCAELKSVSCHLDALAVDLPALTSACDTFTQSAAQFASKRAENKQLLSKPFPCHVPPSYQSWTRQHFFHRI